MSSAASAFKVLSDVPPVTMAAWRLQLTGLLLMPGGHHTVLAALPRFEAIVNLPNTLVACFLDCLIVMRRPCICMQPTTWRAALRSCSGVGALYLCQNMLLHTPMFCVQRWIVMLTMQLTA